MQNKTAQRAMGGKKRALQNTYRTGRDRRRRSRRLPVSGPLSGVGTFSGSRSGPPLSGLLSISRSGPLSGLVSGSRSGPLSGVGTSFGLSIRTSSLRTSINVSIRTSLGIRDFFRALDQDLLSWGLVSGSRSGPLSKLILGISMWTSLGTSFQISIRTSFGISIGAYVKQIGTYPCFLFHKVLSFSQKRNWEFFLELCFS